MPVTALQWAEAECGHILRHVKEGALPRKRYVKTVFVYGEDPKQQISFDSPIQAFAYSTENKARERAMRDGWYQDLMILSPRVPAEPRIWERLKKARSPGQVRCIFRDSNHLKKYQKASIRNFADKIASALISKECPKSDRASSDEKFLLYLARVMAGVCMGYKPSTAVRMLRTMAHHGICPCDKCVKKRDAREACFGEIVERAERDEIKRRGWKIPPVKALIPKPSK